MFGSKSVVDLLVRGGKIEIAVALNGDFAVNSAFGFCDLLFDSAQAASGPIIGVLEVGHRIRGCVFARIACRGLCPDLAVGVVFTGVFPPPGFDHLRHGGGFHRQNVVQTCVNECLFVRRREHPRIGDDGDLALLVAGHHTAGGREARRDHRGVGEVTAEVVAPVAGIIVGRAVLPMVNEGDALFHLAQIAPAQGEPTPAAEAETLADEDEII